MSNDVKWTDWQSFDIIRQREMPADSSRVRSAWFQLVGCVVGLALLAFALPDPRFLAIALAGAADPATVDALLGSTAQAAILATAGLVVWVLLIWSVAVCGAAVAGKLPGTAGLIGRTLLRRIAPAAAGRLVAAAVGVSLLAGTSACAMPAAAALSPGSSTDAVSSQLPGTEPVPIADGSEVVDPGSSVGSTVTSTPPATAAGEVIASIVIDWPDVAAPTVGVPTATTTDSPPSTSAPAPTAPTPTAPTPTVGQDDARPLSGPNTVPTEQPPGQPAEPVTVRGGDSLWTIAAHQLPPDVSDADIDTAWRAWYSTNENVIGDDPNLIQPGQLLLPPPR